MKSTRIMLAVVLALALGVGATGCTNKDTAAKVNGEVITKTELNAQVEQLKKQYPTMFQGADGEGRLIDFKQRLLDNLINQKLIEQAAKDKGLKVSDADVTKQVEQLKSGFKDDKQFQQALKAAGMDPAALDKQVRDQLVTMKLIESLSQGSKPTADEIKAYYDTNKAQFYQKAAKRASHILFKPEDKATAEKVLAQIKAGSDFASLAKQYSIDTATASKGGDLGWPTTPYVAEFQAALDSLKVGMLSGLVQTPYGWHIIKVTDERPAVQQTLEQVSAQISQIIQQQRKADAYQKFLDGLRKKAKIEIFDEQLKASSKKNVKTGTGTTGTTDSTGTKK
jgi:foldase protein PrsA